jgi:toxin-antitoxin system PIN domain toxin
LIAVDTNVLVYAHRSAVPEHRRARAALERAANDTDGWGISLPVLGEFWSIVTHPKALGGPSTVAQAASFIRALIASAEMKVWVPEAGFPEYLLQRAVNMSVSGARIFDLQIALIAANSGAREIWTHDQNFVGVPGIRIRDPL